jgi:hypothetical protein
MGVLIQQIEDCPVGRFESVRASDFDQLRRLRKAVKIGLLCSR